MLKHSCPPVIVLMDVLFIFLFSFLLEVPPKTDIQLPLNINLFPNAEVLYLASDNKDYWYDQKNQKWKPQNDLNSREKIDTFINLKCNQRCDGIPLPNGYNNRAKLQITLVGELHKRILGLTYLACNTDAKKCGNLKFKITENGTIDLKKALEENPVLKQIRGIDNLL